MKSSLKAYNGGKGGNIARGLKLLVHFQIGLKLVVTSLPWLLLVGFHGSVLLENLELRG